MKRTHSAWSILYVSALAFTTARSAPAQTPETGPRQQRVSNRAAGAVGETLNSVVEVNGVFPGCTGSVVGKRVVGNTGWLAVLTADHCVRELNAQTIVFGDTTGAPYGLTGVYGGASPADSWYVSRSPTGTAAEDLAVVAIKYGAPDAAFNSILSLTRVDHPAYPAPIASAPFNQFTEIGYGGTGLFANGGMNGIGSDGNKRFQNNVIERWNQVNNATYNYWSLQWDFNVPAAAGFLAAEGLSYGGDSGGPYFSYAGPLATENIPQFDRWQAGWSPNVPNWPGGNMMLTSDFIFAVHTRGNSVYNGFSPFNRWGAGVPLTNELNQWITHHVGRVPEPGTLGLLAVGGLIMLIRRSRQ